MAYKMNMGDKEKNTPGNFSESDTNIINNAPQGSRFSHPDFTREKSVVSYDTKEFGGEILGTSRPGIAKPYNKPKVLTESPIKNSAVNKNARIAGRLDKTQRKGEAATKAGKLQKARRLQARKQRLLKRQK